MASKDERFYWLAFATAPGVGPKRFSMLLEEFTSAKSAWQASQKDTSEIIGETLSKKLEKFKASFSIKDYLIKLNEKNVSFVTKEDALYPALLKEIPSAPYVLFIKGNISVLHKTNPDEMLAVVGTRRVTSYGEEVTRMLVRELVDASFVIVSGLALGVDAIAHAVTITNGGVTIAVLGCGVDCCYPSSNKNLYDRIIASGGAIISEYPLGMSPSKGSFPSRNRIIAGMAGSVLVTEGAEDSGSLITAKHALSFGRRVFAVPGPITSGLSKGPYALIEQGAKLVTSGKDILKELGIKNHEVRSKRKEMKGETKEEQKIIDLLQNEPMHMDTVIKETGFSASTASSLLSLMEIKGILYTTRDGLYALIQSR